MRRGTLSGIGLKEAKWTLAILRVHAPYGASSFQVVCGLTPILTVQPWKKRGTLGFDQAHLNERVSFVEDRYPSWVGLETN